MVKIKSIRINPLYIKIIRICFMIFLIGAAVFALFYYLEGRLRFSENGLGKLPAERNAYKREMIKKKDWTGYDKINLSSLVRPLTDCWKTLKNPGFSDSSTVNEEKTKSDRKRKNYEVEASYSLELQERLRLTEDTLRRCREQLEIEIERKLNQKKNQLKYEMEKAISEKSKMLEEELAEFRRETEAEYFLRLTNLRFKLQLPGLPAEDQEDLKRQIAAIEEEMAGKVEEKAAELDKDMASFIERRKKAAADELQAYHRQLLYESEVRYREEKKQLENELRAWQERMKEKMEEK